MYQSQQKKEQFYTQFRKKNPFLPPKAMLILGDSKASTTFLLHLRCRNFIQALGPTFSDSRYIGFKYFCFINQIAIDLTLVKNKKSCRLQLL